MQFVATISYMYWDGVLKEEEATHSDHTQSILRGGRTREPARTARIPIAIFFLFHFRHLPECRPRLARIY